ncbi:MAG: hypothetical protein EA413_13445 [Cyanobium sp. PLM2.Bin73]|jgi:hypothetical protein|nr:MAG: hypothetical protein EA413_13445 [Cyanobium sp. PLM2.Bin73]
MNVLQTNPHLGFTTAATVEGLYDSNPDAIYPIVYYPPCMVSGQVALATVSGLPVWGNTIEVDGFPRIYQLGTFSPINATLADDDVLFFFLPEDGTVPSGWQPTADVYPWRDPVTPSLWVMPQPPRQRRLQPPWCGCALPQGAMVELSLRLIPDNPITTGG